MPFSTSKTIMAAWLTASAAVSVSAFAPAPFAHRSTALRITDDDESIMDKVRNLFKSAPKPTEYPEYDGKITSIFPNALSNEELAKSVTSVLDERGFTGQNTLLATSLCCDELARRLEDDFVSVYGNNFNLGGLSGFPFAGTTGFGAMAAHIPDDGACLVIYGPHVGVATTGVVGKVERRGIELVDTCCGSAVAASNYVKAIVEGGAPISTSLQEWTDFQQSAVQELILPHGKRLADAEDPMVELPYAIYDSADVLMGQIVNKGSGSIKKKGLALLGGIQINTAPEAQDYFLPLRFDYVNSDGEVMENLLPLIMGKQAAE